MADFSARKRPRLIRASLGWTASPRVPGTLPCVLSSHSESQRLNYGENMQTNIKQDFFSSVRSNLLLSHTDVRLSNSCYGKMSFIFGRFLPGRSIRDLLLLSHIIQRLGTDDSCFWPTTFKLCFRLFGKCETAHLHGSKLGLYCCCFGEGDSLDGTSTERPLRHLVDQMKCGFGRPSATRINGTVSKCERLMKSRRLDPPRQNISFREGKKNQKKKIEQEI